MSPENPTGPRPPNTLWMAWIQAPLFSTTFSRMGKQGAKGKEDSLVRWLG